MMNLADRMAVDRVRVPLQTPTPKDVAVVPSPPQDQRARDCRNEGDVGERAADEVVATVSRPMDDAVHARDQIHVDSSWKRDVRYESVARAGTGWRPFLAAREPPLNP